MFEEIKFNPINFYHFNFDMYKEICKENKGLKELEKDINKCIADVKDKGMEWTMMQGQYFIFVWKTNDGDIEIYVSSNFYHSVLIPNYKPIDWINDNDE